VESDDWRRHGSRRHGSLRLGLGSKSTPPKSRCGRPASRAPPRAVRRRLQLRQFDQHGRFTPVMIPLIRLLNARPRFDGFH
jgi:hypothetical protein